MSTNHPKENGWFVTKQHTRRIPDRKTPITKITLEGWKLKRIHPERIKKAKNSPLKGKNCKKFTLKRWKMQRIHPQRAKIAKNSPSKGKKWEKSTLKKTNKGWNCKEFIIKG